MIHRYIIIIIIIINVIITSFGIHAAGRRPWAPAARRREDIYT